MTREEILTVAKPILFNTEMTRAIKDNRKTVTRRVVKPQPAGDDSKPEPLTTRPGYWNTWGDDNVYRQPYRPGNILYVRETWYYETFYEDTDNTPDLPSGNRSWRYVYKADNPGYPVIPGHWRPSIHMPKEAARLFLQVTDVRVERVRNILPCDIQKEGCPYIYSGFCEEDAPDWYGWMESTWDSTIKPADRSVYGWDANPWVWVIGFEKMEEEK